MATFTPDPPGLSPVVGFTAPGLRFVLVRTPQGSARNHVGGSVSAVHLPLPSCNLAQLSAPALHRGGRARVAFTGPDPGVLSALTFGVCHILYLGASPSSGRGLFLALLRLTWCQRLNQGPYPSPPLPPALGEVVWVWRRGSCQCWGVPQPCGVLRASSAASPAPC